MDAWCQNEFIVLKLRNREAQIGYMSRIFMARFVLLNYYIYKVSR